MDYSGQGRSPNSALSVVHALFEIDDSKTVTILAVRHQREDDYH